MPTLKQKFQRTILTILRGLFKFAKFLKRIFRSKKTKTLAFATLLVIIILPIYFWISGRNTEASWWNDTWGFRKKITINKSQVAGELQNFPVLVSITDTNLITGAQTDGDDLVFTDSTGKKLSHEIESYTSATGALIAWVKLPNLTKAKDTEIYLYYGNATVTSQQDKTNVWDQNYKMVQHLHQDPSGTAPQMTDSTSNANNGTSNGTMTSGDLVAGKVGNAVDFDGSDDYIQSPTVDFVTTSNQVHSFFAWVYPRDVTTAQAIISFGERDDTGYSTGLGIYGDQVVWFWNGADVDTHLDSGLTILPNQWSRIGFVRTADSVQFFVNGSTSSVSDEIHNGATDPDPFLIGCAGWNTSLQGFFNGQIDSARVSNSIRTPEWIATEYANQNNPGTFLTVSGKQETNPNNPIGYWSLDEGQGTTAHDDSGNGHTGTVTGATWKPESECVSGKCLQFDGSGDKVDAGDINF